MSDHVYVCPECASPSVEFSTLEGGNGTCKACGWAGTKSELLAVPFSNKFGTEEEILMAIRSEWRGVFGKFGTELGRFLVRWGFMSLDGVSAEGVKKTLVRYLTAMASSSLVAVMRERQLIEKERINGVS
jgi:hypothetical protein